MWGVQVQYSTVLCSTVQYSTVQYSTVQYRCEETEEGQYSGKYCEDCPTCPGKCEELKSCVQCKVFQSGELWGVKDEHGVDKCDLCPFEPEVVEKAEDHVNTDERICTFIDDDDCRFTFIYGYLNDTGKLQV